MSRGVSNTFGIENGMGREHSLYRKVLRVVVLAETGSDHSFDEGSADRLKLSFKPAFADVFVRHGNFIVEQVSVLIEEFAVGFLQEDTCVDRRSSTQDISY